MRKIKVELLCRVPSWNFCNHDGPTADMRYSKELCRFCQRNKDGSYYCLLAEKRLTYDGKFVTKAPECIEASAGFATTISEPAPVKPQLIIKEAIKAYNQNLAELLKQGYPRPLAEKVAIQLTSGEN